MNCLICGFPISYSSCPNVNCAGFNVVLNGGVMMAPGKSVRPLPPTYAPSSRILPQIPYMQKSLRDFCNELGFSDVHKHGFIHYVGDQSWMLAPLSSRLPLV